MLSYPYILFFLNNLPHLLLLGFTFTCILNSSYWFRTFFHSQFSSNFNVAKSIFLSQNFSNNIPTSHFSVFWTQDSQTDDSQDVRLSESSPSGTVKRHTLLSGGFCPWLLSLIYQEECVGELNSGCCLVSDLADEELKETPKDQDSDEMELTSNVTLVWSDEDEDVTV